MSETRIRVAMADDHALFRQGLRSLLRTQPDVAIVGETDVLDGITALFDEAPCDVLLLDLRMDRIALEQIPALTKRTKVIVVTASENLTECVAAVQAGAAGVVFKRFAVETLMQALHVVAAGGTWLPPSCSRPSRRTCAPDASRRSPPASTRSCAASGSDCATPTSRPAFSSASTR